MASEIKNGKIKEIVLDCFKKKLFVIFEKIQ